MGHRLPRRSVPGDILRFDQSLTHLGRASFTMRTAPVKEDILIATAEFVFVCINRDGCPYRAGGVAATMGSGGDATGDARRFTVNGVTLAVEVRGDGPAVLFVHGYPFDRSIWSRSNRRPGRLPPHRPSISAAWVRPTTPTSARAWRSTPRTWRRCSTCSGWRRSVCGLFMGGYIAFECLRRWRQRVRGLVLMDTRAEADTAEGRKARDAAAALARDGVRGGYRIGCCGAWAIHPDRSQHHGRAGPRHDVVHAGLRTGRGPGRHARPAHSSPLLPELAGLPTLVMVGEEDATPSDPARVMANRIPAPRLVIIPGSGHLPPVERPVETTRALVEFLRALR